MDTIYDTLGKDNLQLLVTHFYNYVEKDDRINHLFKGDFDSIRNKQFLFLSQFLGGPGLYSAEFGHPKMRARHIPHTITNEGKDAWLECMKKAIDKLDIEDGFKNTLYNCFPAVAQHMVNS